MCEVFGVTPSHYVSGMTPSDLAFDIECLKILAEARKEGKGSNDQSMKFKAQKNV